MVVATYHPPQDCPCGDMPIFFASSAEAAAAKALEMAGGPRGDRDRGVAQLRCRVPS